MPEKDDTKKAASDAAKTDERRPVDAQDAAVTDPDSTSTILPTHGTAPFVGEEKPDPDNVEADENVKMRKAGKGKVYATYHGHADVGRFREGDLDIKFQPGVPTEVPKEITEALLTHPHERFTVADQAPGEAEQDEE